MAQRWRQCERIDRGTGDSSGCGVSGVSVLSTVAVVLATAGLIEAVVTAAAAVAAAFALLLALLAASAVACC